jgi:hypothetical protein
MEPTMVFDGNVGQHGSDRDTQDAGLDGARHNHHRNQGPDQVADAVNQSGWTSGRLGSRRPSGTQGA